MKIKVAIADFPPLIFDQDKRYKGFEIDLWEAITKIIGVDFEYEKHNFKEIIPLLAEKRVDVGLAGITINESREKIINFSHATLDSGILISVNKNRNKLNFFKTIKNIFIEGHKAIKSAMLFLVIYIFVFGNLIWLAEKNVHTFSATYFPGIFESFWLTVVSMTTVGYGDYIPHSWLGRIVVSILVFGGAIMLSLIVAQFTAFFAVKKIKGEISNSRDLLNKKVATVEGSTSESILKKIGAKIVAVLKIEEAYIKLKNGEVDAVVFDAPVVLYYEKNDMDNDIEIIGEMFDKQRYGIALQQPDQLEEKINRAILNLKESGQYDLLYRKWFGEDLIMEI